MPRTSTYSYQGHKDSISAVVEVGIENRLVTVSFDNTVKTWTTHDGCVNSFSKVHNSLIYDVAVLDDKAMTALTVSWDKTAKVVDLNSGNVLASRTFPAYLFCCAVLDSTTVVVGDNHGNVFKCSWDGETIEVLRTIEGAHDATVIAIYSFGDSFATCSKDKSAKLWDSTSMALIHSFRGHTSAVNSVAYDGTHFVTVSDDRSIRVYDARTFNIMSSIQTHSDKINCVRLVKGANIAVTGGLDKTIALHTLPFGECIAQYRVDIKVISIAVLSSRKLAIVGWKPYDVKIIEIDELPSPLLPAVRNFKAAIKAKDGKATLTMDEATEALNTTLKAMGTERHLKVHEFEERFLGVSWDIEVTECKFLEVLRGIIEDGIDEERLTQEYTQIFKKYVKERDSTSVHYATRILMCAYKEMKERGLVSDRQFIDEEEARTLMMKFDNFGDGSIECSEFIDAALSILHDKKRKKKKSEFYDDFRSLRKMTTFRVKANARRFLCGLTWPDSRDDDTKNNDTPWRAMAARFSK